MWPQCLNNQKTEHFKKVKKFIQNLLTYNKKKCKMTGHKMLCLTLCPFILQTVSRGIRTDAQEFPRRV